MVKFRGLSVHCMDWAQTCVTSFGPGLIFMTSFITYNHVTLTTDGLMRFLQLMSIQNIHKNMCFSPNKSYRTY